MSILKNSCKIAIKLDCSIIIQEIGKYIKMHICNLILFALVVVGIRSNSMRFEQRAKSINNHIKK